MIAGAIMIAVLTLSHGNTVTVVPTYPDMATCEKSGKIMQQQYEDMHVKFTFTCKERK